MSQVWAIENLSSALDHRPIEQQVRIEVERSGQPMDVVDANVPFASLDAADVVAVKPGPFREFFL